jgi:ribonuclease-3
MANTLHRKVLAPQIQSNRLTTVIFHTNIMSTQAISSPVSKLHVCEALISYTFTNRLLLLEALNNTSLPILYNNRYHTLQKNDVLAVLGDTRMDAVLCRWWWDAEFPRNKGQWSQMRLEKCGNAALVQLGRTTGMDTCVIKNPGTTVVSDKMVATAVEAVMGAVYLDGGEVALEGVMTGLDFDVHRFLC